MSDSEFQLQRWIPQIVELCCKLRGYKAEVHEERVLAPGTMIPAEIIRTFAKAV